MKVTYSLIARFACTVVAINVLSAFAPAQTVEQRLAALESANTALNAKIAKLEKQIYDLNGANIYQDARIATLELKTQFIQVSGKTTKFVGTNVQIQKDNGVDGVANGLGNLIIGRNAERTDLYKAVRTGSHNIVMGDQNGYAGSNSFVGGYRNSVEADYSVILTGRDNIITPPDSGSVAYSLIGTGDTGRVRGMYSGVFTGYHNVIDGFRSAIVAGYDNKIEPNGTNDSAMLTGQTNLMRGAFNAALSGRYSTIIGNGVALGTGKSQNAGLGGTKDVFWWRFYTVTAPNL